MMKRPKGKEERQGRRKGAPPCKSAKVSIRSKGLCAFA